ncbi:MAG: GMC oxidoreductase [Pseudomonadota bacterium]|nr:GMC oxidoreductase [Pseudomonadota bacterium]
MARSEPEKWSQQDLQASRTPLTADGDIDRKLALGSDHPYRTLPDEVDIDYRNVAVRGSLALGGLSDVWGAALLPYVSTDIGDWPISAADLGDAHAAIMRILPVAGAQDDLTQLFPLPVRQLSEPKKSIQAQRLLARLERNRAQLAVRGVFFGAARLAVDFNRGREPWSCNYCGNCLHGCPRDLIYSSRHTLEQLQASGRLSYVPGVVVKAIEEHGDRVTVRASLRGAVTSFEADRVLVASGVFNTAAIVLRSLGWYGRTVEVADSQYYILPLLQLSAAPDVMRERLHTLAQIFIEIRNEKISEHFVHLQIYGFNDLMAAMLRQKLRWLWSFAPKNAILGRLLLAQGYLHSDHSGKIGATLVRHANADRLELVATPNPETGRRVRRVVSELRRLSVLLHAMPLSFLLRILQPGRGFHCGGSFPMATRPRVGEVDVLGRLNGWQRTHIVDASVFPSIPATTITQTVMANAFRIGSQAARLDPRELHR